MFTKYDKFLVGALGVVLTGLSALYGSNPTVQLVISVAVALGVFATPNKV